MLFKVFVFLCSGRRQQRRNRGRRRVGPDPFAEGESFLKEKKEVGEGVIEYLKNLTTFS